MPYITEDIADGDYATNLQAFVGVAAANADALGLTPQQVEELNTEVGELDQLLAQVAGARAAYTAAAGAKEAQLGHVRQIVSTLAKTWRANPAIPDPLLDELMLAPHVVPRRVSRPNVVTDLVVTASGTGEIFLKWNPNGNLKTTVYVIETATSGAGPWTVLDAVTGRRFSMMGNPGEPIWFRIRAKRGSRTSGYCAPVGMWAGSGFRLAVGG